MADIASKPLVDPRTRFPKPPFPEQQQPMPGDEDQMEPKADHGQQSYTGTGRLQGRAALITGGDSGIGRAVALCFAKEGADILFTCLPDDQEDADKTVELVKATGRQAIALPGDVRQKAFCQQLVDKAVESFGKLDILVNNAAYQQTHESMKDITEEEFDRTFRTNVFAPFFLAQAATKVMKPGGRHSEHLLDRKLHAGGAADYLRRDEGSAGQPYDQHFEEPDEAGYPRERRGTGAGVDTIYPVHHAAAAGGKVRLQHCV